MIDTPEKKKYNIYGPNITFPRWNTMLVKFIALCYDAFSKHFLMKTMSWCKFSVTHCRENLQKSY